MKKLLILLSLMPIAAMANPSDRATHDCEHKSKDGVFKKHHKSVDKPFYLKGIELTDTQKAQIKALMEKRRTDFGADKKAAHANRQALSKLTMAETYDAAAAETLIDKQTQAYKKRSMAQAKFHHDVYQLLTTEQRDALKQKMEKFKQKHQRQH